MVFIASNKNVTVNVRMSEQQKSDLEVICAETNENKSSLIMRLLEQERERLGLTEEYLDAILKVKGLKNRDLMKGNK